MAASAHPKRVDPSGDVVPDDRQWNQGAPQLGVDAVAKDVLVGVIVRERDAAEQKERVGWSLTSTPV